MLDTVLQIGRAFRESPTRLKHHRYVKSCPQDTEKESVLRLSIPVKEDDDSNLKFDFDKIEIIKDENIIREKLYYLKFKTSDSDGLVKYLFGDIFYEQKSGKEGGYYRLGDTKNRQKAYQVSSFLKGENDYKSIKDLYDNEEESKKSIITKFHLLLSKSVGNGICIKNQYREIKNIELIERILKYNNAVYEYFNSSNNNIEKNFTDFILNEKELQKLNAQRVFIDIKQRRNSKKLLTKIFGKDTIPKSTENLQENEIEILNKNVSGKIFLHFDFEGKHWYEFENKLNILNKKMLEDFTEKIENPKGFILKKYLYKTLSSAEKDVQFPNFLPQGRYRNKIFYDNNEILDLYYAIDYSKIALLTIRDIKVIVLPKGNNLTAENYIRFIEKDITFSKVIIDEHKKEEIIEHENKKEDIENPFIPILERSTKNMTQFDIIFSKRGGTTSPDVDLVEISGIEKSLLQYLNKRIINIQNSIEDERKYKFKIKLKQLNLIKSLYNIFGDVTKEKKKYQNHLFKILPKVYSGTYYYDAILLNTFIEQVEYKIRQGKSDYNLLKYDFVFLIKIQNTKKEGENLMKIQESQSYKIGQLLGEMASQFASWRKDCPIKSFEKSYVGNLTRRISTLNDLIKFKNDIEQKLIMHERTKFTYSPSIKLSEKIKELGSNSEKYDKNVCAFGFFESYFSTSVKRDEKTKVENNEENILTF